MKRLVIFIFAIILFISQGFGTAEGTKLIANYGISSVEMDNLMADHPEIKIEENVDFSNLYQGLAGILQTHDSSIDIIRVTSDIGTLKPLRSKGYYYDLSVDKDIAEFVNGMNPLFREQIMSDGEIMGLPTFVIFQYVITINKKVQSALQIPDKDLPGNMLEWIEFIDEWDERYGDTYPQYQAVNRFSGVALYSIVDRVNPFWSLVMEKYIDSMLATGQDLQFDTPLFRDLLDAIAPFTKDHTYWDWIGEDVDLENCLFHVDTLFDYEMFNFSESASVYHLPIGEGWPEVLGCQMECTLVNPAGKHLDTCITVMRELINYYPPERLRILLPSLNEPYQSPEYGDRIRELQTGYDNLKTQIEKESDEEKLEFLEFELGGLQESLQYYLDHPYQISPESIEYYRENIEPWIFPIGESKYDAESFYADLAYIMETLGDESVSNDQLIQRLDHLVMMREREGAY